MDALCLDFINSEFRDFRGRWVRDDLQRPEWLAQFLVKWELQVEILPDEVVMTALVALRTRLQRIIEMRAQEHLSTEDREALNTLLLNVPLYRALAQGQQGYNVVTYPLKKDWDWVQAEVVASFVHLLAEHDPRRLKACANIYCRSAFYDDTKSRTKRYCTPEKCANLWKVRRFRAHRQ